MKVLICEDDIGIQDMIEIILADMGHTLLKVEEPDEVLSTLDSNSIDLIIMDYWLKDVKADVIIRKVKQSFPKIPILLISAVNNLEEVQADLQVSDYLKKPFDIMAFQSKVKTLLYDS